MSRPIVAITMGDPAGIGPEVVVRALADPAVRRRVSPLLFGDLAVFEETARRLKLQVPRFEGSVPFFAVSSLAPRDRRPGRPTTAGGDAAYRAIVAATTAVRKGDAAALVTAPISKANIAAAGHRFAGHTELLAEMCGASRVRMMMAGPKLRVVLATTHVALRRVPALLTTKLVLETIAVAHAALRDRFGIRRPRIAVCGLNPHAGEAGMFGSEDEAVILPAVRQARRRRIDAVGPVAADSIFAHAASGTYDAVVCMYHDQGLAPFKLLHFADGVNVTLGLPIVRTSPDHGTAFDIAGTGCADPSSMIAAVRLAAELARKDRKRDAPRTHAHGRA